MTKKVENPLEKMIDKSIKELNDNARAVEAALEKIAMQEGIEISEQEYSEIKYLTDTMSELDELLLSLNNRPVTKKKPKKKAKRRRK